MQRTRDKENTLFKLFELHKTAFNKATKLFVNDGIEVPIDQLPVLMVVYYEGEMSQQAIADKLLRDKSSILRSIISLEAKGFVLVSSDGADKRKKIIALTRIGETQAEMIAKKLTELDKKLFSFLTEKERKDFEALLSKCSNHIKNL